MFLATSRRCSAPSRRSPSSATALQNSLSGLDRVLDLLAEPLEMPPTPGAIAVDRDTVAGRITFRDVSFAYSGSAEPVLHDINLDVRRAR